MKKEIKESTMKTELVILLKITFTYKILCDGMAYHKNGDHAANIALEILSMDFMNFFTYTNIEDLKSFIFNSIMNIKNEMKKIAIDSLAKKRYGYHIGIIYVQWIRKKLIVFYSMIHVVIFIKKMVNYYKLLEIIIF
ncbi:hypothetical protein [Mycoplasmopsis cynos]|uniref:hypothetical protein n=1 Tax=Mycoplasmopsis cynos TaxID=171284 RepID=UPI0024C94B7F|nr:hypothetical protein [Mycoplasmopsis cynos]WAM08153.1 hypothetical protein ONA21_02455 [Mycoplasmopsis cynos]